jgi:L-alanine-DL-glutamate epimerase-like enolase superfamily enzyme
MSFLEITNLAIERCGPHGLIEVRTAEGLAGYGEGAWAEDLLRRRPELVIGRSAFEVESIFEDLGEEAGGLDIALWDLIGRALGMPVCRILGKTFRTQVAQLHAVPDAPIVDGLSLAPDTLIRDLVQHEKVDIALQDVGRCGLTGLKRLTYFCWLFHVRLAPCSNGTRTGTAAALHAAACIPPVTNAIAAPPVFIVVPGEGDRITDVPAGPGLGAEIGPISGTPYFELGGRL